MLQIVLEPVPGIIFEIHNTYRRNSYACFCRKLKQNEPNIPDKSVKTSVLGRNL